MREYGLTVRTEKKIQILDYTKIHLKMLLYKSMGHFNTWATIGQAIAEKDKEEFLVTSKIYPLELLKPPEIIQSFNFNETDMLQLKQIYMLSDWEKSLDKCPFCRVTPGDRGSPMKLMRILSKNVPEGSLNRGGATTHCIHLLWDAKYEILDLDDWNALG